MSPVGKAVVWFVCSWVLIMSAVGFLAPSARGHDAGGWQYPSFCCHEADCAAVDKEIDGMAQTKLHARITTKPEPYLHKMTSPDGKMHICATPDKDMAGREGRHFYCIFNPAGM